MTNGTPAATTDPQRVRHSARHRPLRGYRFQLLLHDSLEPVLGAKSLSGLSWSIESTETWEGGNNRHRYANPNRVTWDPVTLEAGIIAADASETVEGWAMASLAYATGRVPAYMVKQNVIVLVWDDPLDADMALFLDEPRNEIRRFLLKNAWVSKYTPLPSLDATSSDILLESIEITHEGFEPDITNP